ncbi:hypothetical protein A4H97_30515 [Niastella yeongjuensis]|uniref:DUF4468 domain-containing protein n=1 Tax=Niastella yeongjuensis TaxID=354355 RepID=A0A1V9EP04_9BACT|nr:hypothetical protein [Niastella yeongjuensis]OQP47846.1 hypothetical protein A4H97_30515 [Niastella yeongjuensis]SEP48309.1 hypothetical protein SAMN05660816_06742 [Niastella yeongjuensis]
MRKASIIILSLLLFSQTYLFGQETNARRKAIDTYAYQLDTTKSSTDTITFLFDTIQVKAQVQNNRISATCLFKQSKSLLTINFYSRGNILVSVKVREQSPHMSDMFSNSSFYYDKGQLFDVEYFYTVRPCMAIPMDKSIYEQYGYNPNLNADFLKQFVLRLYGKIKSM